MEEQIRILCVDDEKSIPKAIKRSFLDTDYEILNATSGPEGLEILREGTSIHVVISDYRMPGMNGVEFLKEVCKSWPETIRILISGFADLGAIVSAINEGQISKFVPKPWDEDHLKAAISDAIRQYCYRQENRRLTQELKKRDGELQGMNHEINHLRNILFAFPMAMTLVDLDGVILYCNKKGGELLGKDGQEIIGTHRRDSLPDEINALIERSTQKDAFSGELSLDNHLFKVTGSRIKEEAEKEAMILIFDQMTA